MSREMSLLRRILVLAFPLVVAGGLGAVMGCEELNKPLGHPKSPTSSSSSSSGSAAGVDDAGTSGTDGNPNPAPTVTAAPGDLQI